VSGVDVLGDVLCFWSVNVVPEDLVHRSHFTVKDMAECLQLSSGMIIKSLLTSDTLKKPLIKLPSINSHDIASQQSGRTDM
jgi:hypothetical protein